MQRLNKTINLNTAKTNYRRLLWQIIAVLLVTVLVSCNNTEEQSSNDAESIRRQITEYNEQITELNQQVAELENQLERMGEQPNHRRSTAVSVSQLEKQPFTHYINVSSNVEAVDEASISPEINGQIKSIEVSRGQQVTRGQEVIRLNTSVIEANIEEVRTSLQLAETVYNRQKALWDQEIGSEIQYLEAQNTVQSLRSRMQTLESQMNQAVVRSPINGVVDDIFVQEGELAMPGVPLIHIINLDHLYINADVSESYLPAVNTNDEVILRFPTFPDFEQNVKIHRLGNVINPENRTFRLQLRIPNNQGRFKPNMVATIAIKSFETDSAIVVPSILVKQDPQGHYVYIANQTDQNGLVASKAYIEREMDSEGRTMIKAGLKEGDMLIRQGHNQVSDGGRVRINNR